MEYIQPMSTKEIVLDLIKRLPNDVSLHEVAQEIEFIAGVQEGFNELDQGRGVPIEEVEKQLPSWIIK